MRKIILIILFLSGQLALSTSFAATVAYYDEANFQLSLDTFTLVNLEYNRVGPA